MTPASQAAAPPLPEPPTDLPFEDGEPMDSPWHRAEIDLLIGTIEYRWRGRKDFFVGGNMFLHFSREQVRNRDFRGPDFFCVKDVDHDRPRLYWAVWEEQGRYPDVIIELLSPTTAQEDRTTKKRIYERTFRTPEYFCYDPDSHTLEGWRLSGRRYAPIAPADGGRLWSEELELWLGPWTGELQGHRAVWLRFFEADGSLSPNSAEAEARRAATAEERARAAEAEIERLRRELESLRQSPPPSE